MSMRSAPLDREYDFRVPKLPFLTAAEERELAARRDAGDESAVAELVRRNLPLLPNNAKRFRGKTRIVGFGDLVHEGYFGLVQAARRYNPDRGRFSTCATQYIRAAMCAAVIDYEYTVRSPRYVSHLMDRVRREPSTRDARERVINLGIPPKQAEHVLSGLATREITSLSGFERAIAERDDDAEARRDADERRTLMKRSLSVLNARERAVIVARYLRDDAALFRDIAAELGITKQRAQQIEQEAIAKMRRFLAA